LHAPRSTLNLQLPNLQPLLLFGIGFTLPYALTCLILWRAGVWHQFVFWTISYARHYASGIARVDVGQILRLSLDAAIGANLAFWILPWFGLLGLSEETRKENSPSPQPSPQGEGAPKEPAHRSPKPSND